MFSNLDWGLTQFLHRLTCYEYCLWGSASMDEIHPQITKILGPSKNLGIDSLTAFSKEYPL